MNTRALKIIDELVLRYPILSINKSSIISSAEALCDCFGTGNKLLCCGNGGSASDSLHIVGELMKSFVMKRRIPQEIQDALITNSPDSDYLCKHLQGALPAIALVSSPAIDTAFANDCAPDLVFAQEVLGLGNKGDILLGISTSGNSANVIYAMQVAKAKGMKTIALTGKGGGKLSGWADILIDVYETETYKVQELHLPVYHAICMAVESEIYEVSEA